METHHQPRQMYANHKMCLDHAKIEAYLAGKNIYPRTIEIDLINRCSRACPACPSAGSTMPPAVLTDRFVDRLLGILEGETHGVILSGGEPTISPYFAEIMRIARQRQFQEVAVITNGSELERPEIQAALLEYGTSVRVSLYDWYDGDEPKTYFFKQLERIAGLRRRVEETGSRLEIGVSLLTSRRRLPALLRAVGPAGGSGAHWVYFHPLCQNWLDGVPVQEDQAGVLPVLLSLRENAPPGVNVYVPEQRYTSYPLVFTSFHAAHFLMQIGANGVN